jgi:subtilisin family serine protease
VIAGAPTGEHRVTLITGDRVTVTDLAGGSHAVSVETAVPGAGYQTVTVDDELSVIPSSAERFLAAGVVDPDLFNVTRLIEYGYDDASVDATPVIVELDQGPAAFSAEPPVPGLAVGTPLESIGAAAATAGHADAASTWSALTGTDAAADAGPRSFGADPDVTLGGGIAAIHLDGKVQATLDSSVPWVGAPEAWAEGFTGTGVTVAVLDTGYDDTHPDLAGRVLPDSTSFVPGEEVAWDPNGHGTHVASTIAGTGAASGGSHRGVADGANLLVGKVLDASGYGQDSWIIDAMEWAAGRAPIVSMSLGSMQASDGEDLMAEALDGIAEQTGALFVVAAGNNGAPESIGSPGSAERALTVGSVDDPSGALSWFSSQGPLVRSGALKPELAGPGNEVTAARSADYAGAGDGSYLTMSGTSMATPHVAGGAALYLIAHPGAPPDEVRSALRAAGLFDWKTATDRDSTVDPLLDVSSFGGGEGIRLRSSTTSLRIRAGSPAASVRFRLTRLDGHSGDVTMSITGLPPGVIATFSRTTFGGRFFGDATVWVRAYPAAPAADKDIAIVATAGDIQVHHTIRLRVDPAQ